MILQCPSCKSIRIAANHTGRKVCASVGTLAGAASGIAAAASGGRIGLAVGAVAGPAGSVLAGLTGAMIGGAVGAIVVGSAGAALGDFVDENILDNFECLQCGHTFSMATDYFSQ